MSEFHPTPPQPSPAQPLSPADARLWSTLAHVGNIIGFLPALLILLILGPRDAQVRDQSREALNFVITALIAIVGLNIVGAILSTIAFQLPTGIDILFGLLGLLLNLAEFAIYVFLVVFSIVAAVRVNAGGSYRYPFALRLVK
jgi:hypothetical protein